jgi:hypothetical protein
VDLQAPTACGSTRRRGGPRTIVAHAADEPTGPLARLASVATGRGTTTGRRELLVVLLAGIVVLVTVLAGPLVPRWHDAPGWLAFDGVLPTPQPGPTLPPSTGAARDSLQAPAWVTQTVRWLVLATLAVLVFLLLRYLYRLVQQRLGTVDTGGPGDEPAGGDVLDALDDVTQAALQEGYLDAGRALRDELPPSDAVIAAWLALEHAAGRGGVEREPAETATEFTLALLDRTPADPAAARTLLRLYHRARFSDHEVRPGDVAVARAALGVLAAALARPADTTKQAAS